MTTYHEALAFTIQQKQTGEILDFLADPIRETICVEVEQGWHKVFDADEEEAGVNPLHYL